ncbi:DUF167 domain-containing protein [Orrella daihaiensis]|uniref:UPF0235 protein DHf2319_03220 n=1 Tax=Orrella daihaiensis TaxID=2782176 RepID=A0ABY4AKY1_9BURK|nr:DUF167 domain-containing protein [Orrella daihaiensis]UOD50946.1 YggU family protein [Orrella daihaiensis]
MPWLDSRHDHCILRLRIQPGAKRSCVLGVLSDQLKVAVHAPPVDGKANEALLKWLVDTLGLKRNQIELVSGQTSRDKRVRLENIKATQIRAALGIVDGTD